MSMKSRHKEPETQTNMWAKGQAHPSGATATWKPNGALQFSWQT